MARAFIGGGGGGQPGQMMLGIKQVPVTQCPVSGYNAADIARLFAGLDPAAMTQAGQAFTATSRTLTTIAEGLVQHAQILQQSWAGAAAQGAVTSLAKLHDSAVQIARASAQAGAVMSWLGHPILPYYKAYQPPASNLLATAAQGAATGAATGTAVGGPAGTLAGAVAGGVASLFGPNPQDVAAQQHLARLNNRLVQANDGLPGAVGGPLPIPQPTSQVSNKSRSAAPGGYGNGAGGYGGGLPGGGAGGTPRLTGGAPGSGGPGVPGGTSPGSQPGPGGGLHLQGGSVPPPGGGTGGPLPPPGGANVPAGAGVVPFVGGGAAFGAAALGAAGAGNSAGAAGLAADTGLGLTSQEVAAVGPNGMVGSAAASDAAGLAPGSEAGMPMAGSGGGGGQERERARQSWMPEDPAVWEGQVGTVPPTVGVPAS